MKKIFVILLALVVVFSLSLTAGAAAASAKATTLRLAQTENSVTLADKNGGSISIVKGMKLYSGNKLTTGAKSYAWVSLDSTKAAKLDANSKAEISKSGKKLEIKQTAGSLFFNVTAPLKSDESLTLRTSNMATGIRGTSGWVSADGHSLYFLTGTGVITHTDKGVEKKVTVTAGQKATAVLDTEEHHNDVVRIIIEDYMDDEVRGFAAVEIRDDEELQEMVRTQTKLDVDTIVREADIRLAQDEEDDDDDDDDDDEPEVTLVDPLFEEGSGNGGTVVSGDDDDDDNSSSNDDDDDNSSNDDDDSSSSSGDDDDG